MPRKSKRNWKTIELPKEFLEPFEAKFERELYEAAAESDPEDVIVLMLLGNLYTQQGLLEKGLAVDQRLVSMAPEESVFHYNLACSHSLLGDLDPAFEALRRAIQLGYDDREHLQHDSDLENLRCDRRYDELLALLQGPNGPVG